GNDGGTSCAAGYRKVGRIDGFVDALVRMGQALQEQGQLTSALRLYQRVVLLGGHRDQRALHGLGELSHRLSRALRKGAQQRSTTGPEGGGTQKLSRTTSVPLSRPDFGQQKNQHDTSTGTRSSASSSTSASSASACTACRQHTERLHRGGECDWKITHPRQGQVFPTDESIQPEFDMTLLDPGLPSAGSLFETASIGGSEDKAGDVFSEVDWGRDGNGIDAVEDGLGFVVCSFVDSFQAANCLPRGQLRDIGLGWHTLSAEVYRLPSLRPFSCPGGDGAVGLDTESHSTKTVRFCVGDTATSCRAEVGRNNSASQAGHSPAQRLPHAASEIQEQNLPEPPRLRHGASEEERTETTAAAAEQAEIELPFCFMTLALNAMPFITHHAPTFDKVGRMLSERAAAASASPATPTTAAASSNNTSSKTPTDPAREDGDGISPGCPVPPPPHPPESFWEWHVVEGVAAGRANHDNPYSRRRIPDRFFDPATGLSIDGTTEYLDRLVADGGEGASPQQEARIHVHRRCGRRRTAKGTSGEAESHFGDAATTNLAGVPAPHAAMRRGREHGDSSRANGRGSGAGVDGGGDATTSCLWRDKIQMVNTVAFSLEQECLLVQIDADELWTAEQLVRLRDMFLTERNESDGRGANGVREGGDDEENQEQGQQPVTAETGEDPNMELGHIENDVQKRLQQPPLQRQTQHEYQPQQHHDRHNQTPRNRQCAYFHCHFFVGPDLVTVTEDGWGHAASSEWLRAWVFRPRESVWLQHAPPGLTRHDEAAGWVMLAGDKCIAREETRKLGLVFTHYAYVLEEQVRFKDEFYGHSEAARTEETTPASAKPVDAVAEWRALQSAAPPVLLADHLTWLRVQGTSNDPRLLTTVADRPRSSPSSAEGRQWNRSDDRRVGREEGRGSSLLADHGGGGEGERASIPHDCGTKRLSGDRKVPVPSIVPLEGFLRLLQEGRQESSTASVQGRTRGSKRTGNPSQRRLCLTHDVRASLKQYGLDREGRRKPEESVGRGEECGLLHLAVDAVVFQVDAAKPGGMWRVWANVLPVMLDRLNEFEGTCLTLLVRGLAPPALHIQEAFSRLPPERFAVTHVPLYNPSFGYVADGLMLSWAVRNAGATAFVSTLYTQPSQATTPNIVRVLLVHDVLPEVFGWDMSKGEWLQKARAVAAASTVVAVSQHTAKSFLQVYPTSPTSSFAGSDDAGLGSTDSSPATAARARPRSVWVAHDGVDTTVFRPRTAADRKLDDGNDAANAFRRLAGLDSATPYVLVVGARKGYKNARAAYRALGLATSPTAIPTRSSAARGSPALVLVGGGPVVPEELEL
ncbi:unnamed protein product, partial [Hapterophycus canaliculatus]